VTSNLSAPVANELSGLTGLRGGDHDETDVIATGATEDAIQASLRRVDRGSVKPARGSVIVGERSFRRYCSRYEQDGLDGLIDRRLAQV